MLFNLVFALSFYAVKVPTPIGCLPTPSSKNTHSGWLFSALVKFSGNALRDTPKMYFRGDANLIKLIILIQQLNEH